MIRAIQSSLALAIRNAVISWTAALIGLGAWPAAVRAADSPRPLAVPPDQIRAIVQKEYPSLESLYTHIHTHPELSLAEVQTSKRLAEELRAAGFKVTENVGGHGVVAVLENGKGKTLLIRTELDALPVKEETGAPYASTAKG